MKLIGSLIEHLQRWIARYGAELDYAEMRERRRPTPEIEWNGEMIGDYDVYTGNCSSSRVRCPMVSRMRGQRVTRLSSSSAEIVLRSLYAGAAPFAPAQVSPTSSLSRRERQFRVKDRLSARCGALLRRLIACTASVD
jgi:hypothetical protein